MKKTNEILQILEKPGTLESRKEEYQGIPVFINAFWTQKQRNAHSLHEIPYRACFKPELPRFFMNLLLDKPYCTVYDPFMGRGTTLIEAALMRHIPAGNDGNYLSNVLVEPRLNTPTITQVEKTLEKLPWKKFDEQYIENPDLLQFFHPKTLMHLQGLKNYFIMREATHMLTLPEKWIRMCILARITGHSKNFISTRTLPPSLCASVERQKIINEKSNGYTPIYKDIKKIVMIKTLSLLKKGSLHVSPKFLLNQPSFATLEIPNKCIDLTITSPPFLDMVNYEQTNWIRLWFLGNDRNKIFITNTPSYAKWKLMITDTLHELHRITKPGGFVVVETGEAKNNTIKLETAIVECGKQTNLAPIAIVIHSQNFNKISNLWGINEKGSNTHRIVIFQRQ